MEPEQLPGERCLTPNVQFTSTRPCPAADPPAGHDARLAPAAISADLRGQRSLGVLQLRAQIRDDLRLLRRPGLGLAPGLLPDDAGRSPVPPRDIVGSSLGRFGRTRHLASTDGSRAAACSCGNCPPTRSGVAGRKAGNLPGLLKQAGITDRDTRPASPRHPRSWRSARGCSPGPGRPSGQVPGSAASARARLAVAASMVAGSGTGRAAARRPPGGFARHGSGACLSPPRSRWRQPFPGRRHQLSGASVRRAG